MPGERPGACRGHGGKLTSKGREPYPAPALLMTVTAPGKPTPGHRVTVRVSPQRRAEV